MAEDVSHTQKLAREARAALDRNDPQQAKQYLDQIDRALGGSQRDADQARQQAQQQAAKDADKK